MQEKLCIRCGEVETMARVLLIFDWYNAGQCPYVLFNVLEETKLGSISQYKGLACISFKINFGSSGINSK